MIPRLIQVSLWLAWPRIAVAGERTRKATTLFWLDKLECHFDILIFGDFGSGQIDFIRDANRTIYYHLSTIGDGMLEVQNQTKSSKPQCKSVKI